jgi:hypothetical protein
MLRDNGELCRLAALRAGIIHKYVKGHTMRPFCLVSQVTA